MRNTVILIPSYQPTTILMGLINELKDNEFHKIIVVDDGSDATCNPIFEEAETLGALLVRHQHNQGKGEALKTGFRAAIDTFDIKDGIITVDSDGQHSVPDIIRIHDALINNPNSLIMGTRNFNK